MDATKTMGELGLPEQFQNHPELLLCALDSEGLVTFMSGPFAQLLQLSDRNPAVNQPFYKMIHEHDQLSIKQTIEQSFANQSSSVRFKTRPLGSSARWLQITGHLSSSNESQQLLLIANDISKQVELETSYSKYLRLIENAATHSRIGHWHLELPSQKVVWSDEVYQIHGVTRENFTPTLSSAIDCYHPDDVKKVRNCIESAMLEGKEWYFELRIVRPDGEVRMMMVSGNVHLDSHGNPSSVFGICQDITDSRRLQEEHYLLKSAVSNTKLGIIIASPDRNIIWVNAGFELASGYKLEELKGRSFISFIKGKETNQHVVSNIISCLQNGEKVNTRVLAYNKNGEPYWLHLMVTPVYNNAKELTHFVIVQHNITAEIEAQTALQELSHSLEQRIEERTFDLEEENKQLTLLSNEDPLTGALNRRTFYERFETEVKRATRYNQTLCCALLDIDYFKQINDQHGHLFGDRMLKRIVSAINENMRDTDALFRIGGEEFVLIMSNTSNSEGRVVAERMRHAIAEITLYAEGTPVSATISIGLISHQGELNASETLRKVDELLYNAKNKGRNQIIAQ